MLDVDGAGFFAFESRAEDAGRYFARDASVSVASDGTLSDARGLILLGYPANSDGSLNDARTSALVLQEPSLAPQATSLVRLAVNLHASDSLAAAWDAVNPANTSNFSTSSTIYDARGAAHQATIYFANTGSNTWAYHVLVNGAELVGRAAELFAEGCAGEISFSTDGQLSAEAGELCAFEFVGAGAGMTFALDFGTSLTEGGTGFDGTTSFAGPMTTNSSTHDGYAPGTLTHLSADELGLLSANYSNSQHRPIGSVALARFPNSNGLAKMCGSLWAEPEEASTAVFGTAGTPGRGLIVTTPAAD